MMIRSEEKDHGLAVLQEIFVKGVVYSPQYQQRQPSSHPSIRSHSAQCSLMPMQIIPAIHLRSNSLLCTLHICFHRTQSLLTFPFKRFPIPSMLLVPFHPLNANTKCSQEKSRPDRMLARPTNRPKCKIVSRRN